MTWDDRHARAPFPTPDPWLSSLAPVFAPGLPGPVLDLACGLGQNALWARALGAEVLGVDASPVAVGRARSEAQLRGLSARFEEGALGPHGPPPGPWGAILVFNFLDRALFGALAPALAPGGLLAWKTHLAHPLRGDARPRRPQFLLRSGELLRAAAGLRLLSYREWAAPGEAFACLLARRPLSPRPPPAPPPEPRS